MTTKKQKITQDNGLKGLIAEVLVFEGKKFPMSLLPSIKPRFRMKYDMNKLPKEISDKLNGLTIESRGERKFISQEEEYQLVLDMFLELYSLVKSELINLGETSPHSRIYMSGLLKSGNDCLCFCAPRYIPPAKPTYDKEI